MGWGKLLSVMENNNKSESYEKAIYNLGTKLSLLFIFIAILGFLILLLPLIFDKYDFNKLGVLGDLTGGFLNPIIAISAALLTFLAFYIQYQANKQVQDQFSVQQFENQFYKMLDLHKSNVSEMNISFFDHVTSENFTKVKGKIKSKDELTSTEIIRSIEGRKIFNGMLNELNTIISVVIDESNNITKGKNVADYENIYEYLLYYSYRIFFFGLASEQVSMRGSRFQNLELTITLRLLSIQKSFYERHKLSVYNRQNPNQFKFYPFEGHESRLAHYYRNLFAIVKMVTSRYDGEYGSKSYKIARSYLKTLRAQLSNAEQQLLYMNYRIGFGKDWNSESPKKTNYFTTYRMIHNIPVDRIKIPESPRRHFEDYINSDEVNANDPLFEWGDVELI